MRISVSSRATTDVDVERSLDAMLRIARKYNPRNPRDLKIVGCASAPTTTLIAGAPHCPSASTFQPAFCSTAWRAAASAEKFAIVAPVTNAPPHSDGNPKRSNSQRRVTCSIRAVAGVGAYSPVFWSQAPASQLAAKVTGSEPPMTKPKKRGPAIAVVAGEQVSSSCSITCSGGVGASGMGSSSAESLATALGSGPTLRASRDSRR